MLTDSLYMMSTNETVSPSSALAFTQVESLGYSRAGVISPAFVSVWHLEDDALNKCSLSINIPAAAGSPGAG